MQKSQKIKAAIYFGLSYTHNNPAQVNSPDYHRGQTVPAFTGLRNYSSLL